MSNIIKVFNVEGMSCGHCEKAVKSAINELNGVSNTEVSLKDKTVTVSYDSDLVSEGSLKEAIEDAGYDVL